MKYNTATPYCASYVLLKRDGKCVFVKRANTDWRNGYYGLPAGKVEKNESFLAAAVREVKEEVGVTVKQTDLVQVLTNHRKEEGTEWVDVVFAAKSYEGEPFNAEPNVHSEIAWFALEDLPENTIPSLRYMLEQIVAGSRYSEYGWE